jgi:hypothetical protein
MAVLADTRAMERHCERVATLDIDDMRYGFKMVRIDAPAVPAFVIEFEPFGNWPDVLLVGNDVCLYGAIIAAVDATIACL